MPGGVEMEGRVSWGTLWAWNRQKLGDRKTAGSTELAPTLNNPSKVSAYKHRNINITGSHLVEKGTDGFYYVKETGLSYLGQLSIDYVYGQDM